MLSKKAMYYPMRRQPARVDQGEEDRSKGSQTQSVLYRLSEVRHADMSRMDVSAHGRPSRLRNVKKAVKAGCSILPSCGRQPQQSAPNTTIRISTSKHRSSTSLSDRLSSVGSHSSHANAEKNDWIISGEECEAEDDATEHHTLLPMNRESIFRRENLISCYGYNEFDESRSRPGSSSNDEDVFM